MRFAMNALLAIDPTGQMPYLSDGYDNPEMEIRINQPIENEKRMFTGQHLLSILRAGANQKTNILDNEMKYGSKTQENDGRNRRNTRSNLV